MRLRTLTAKNPCGGCTACCTVISARDLGKPFYTPCPHQVEKGCGIYNLRPTCCREYVCIWAAGLLGDAESFRPDRNGLLFTGRRDGEKLWIDIHEVHSGAADDSKRLENLVQRASSRIERIEPVAGTRLHRVGDLIGIDFKPDLVAFPQTADLENKPNRYAPIGGDPQRQRLSSPAAPAQV